MITQINAESGYQRKIRVAIRVISAESMNEQLEQALEQIAEEKGISREELHSMIEASLAAAFRKDYGTKDQNIVVEFDPETMGTKVYDVKTVVETTTEAEEDPQKLVDLESA